MDQRQTAGEPGRGAWVPKGNQIHGKQRLACIVQSHRRATVAQKVNASLLQVTVSLLTSVDHRKHVQVGCQH